MAKLKLTFGVIFGLILAFQTQAQEIIGPHPNQQNWRKLKSPAIDIIYPNALEFKAQRIANFINYIQQNNTRSVGERALKTNIILQNQTVEFNGFVGFAPFRSEFYSIPPQTFSYFGSLEFINLLAIHEYRHVLQFSNSRRGFTKLGYWLQGEFGWAALQSISLPNWYFEGDAVIQETALTEGGRGRIANFTVYQRAIFQADKVYSYNKIRNGSFRDVVPDHYRWGYSMLSYLRNSFGNDTIKPIMHDAARYKKWFYPFSRSLHAYTGLKTHDLYFYAWENDSRIWDERYKSRSFTSVDSISPDQRRTPSFYHFPQYDSLGNLYAWKNSFKETDQIVEIENGEEKVLAWPGYTQDPYFDKFQNLLVWTEFRLNPRRNKASYADLVIYDIESKKKRIITQKGRYFSPQFIKQGKAILAVEVDFELRSRIVQVDIKTGEKTLIMEGKEGEFIARPQVDSREENLVFISQQNNQLSLIKYELRTKNRKQLIPWTNHVIDAPRIHEDQVYFSSDFDQIDNIYRVPLDGSQKIEQVVSSELGAYQPAPNPKEKSIAYSESIFNGQQISARTLDDDFKALDQIVEPIDQVWRDKVAAEAEGGNILAKISDTSYATEGYRGTVRGLKLYAWPIFPSNAAPSLGLNFINPMNDLGLNLEGGYNFNEEGALFGSEIIFGKYFPLFSLGASQGFRQADFIDPIEDTLSEQNFQESSLELNMAIPLFWFAGNYQVNLKPNIGFRYLQVSDREFQGFKLDKKNFALLSTGFQFSYTRRMARQQVAPRLGISTSLDYSRNAAELDDEKFFVQGRVFLPGVWKTHSLQVAAAFQQEYLSNDFQQADAFEYVRGYVSPVNDRFFRLSADYGFPLLYPDWGLWGITYFKRLRMNLFADYGEGELHRRSLTRYYASAGAELIFDQVFLNLVPLSMGIRASSLINEDPENQNEGLIFGIFVATSF